MVRVRVLKIINGMIEIAGMGPKEAPGKKRILRIVNENEEDMPLRMFPMPYSNKYDENGSLAAVYEGFRARLPVYDGASYRFIFEKHRKGSDPVVKKQSIKFGRHSMLQDIENQFVIYDDHVIFHRDGNIMIEKTDLSDRQVMKDQYYRTLENLGKNELISYRDRAEGLRKNCRPIVIISDRVNMARDNGEALFRYLMANGYESKFDIYFAVSKDTPDYDRISEIGPVLDFGSDEYKVKFLAADKIISSGFDGWFSNAFGDDMIYMADLYRFDHYFLQHGIIMNDWSKGLNYTNTGFRMFFTSVEGEYRSIMGETYGYEESEVCLTGLARYDLLENEAEKLIVIAPTWRKSLAGEVDRAHGSRFYSEDIKGSDFYGFYQGLINDSELLQAMREEGYKGEFYLHPSFIANYEDFTGNDVFKVLRDADYNRVFRKAAILVTDYSSVNMDFAYLNKPVIYSQFDRETFFDQHGCNSGYFDYERDGFGPICTTISEVRDNIISLIRRGCTMDPKYVHRTNGFFSYRDKNNCFRIANVIFGNGQERG